MPPSRRRGQLKAISSNKKAKTGLDINDQPTTDNVNVMAFEDDDTVSDADTVNDAKMYDQYSDTTLVDSDDAGSVSDTGSVSDAGSVNIPLSNILQTWPIDKTIERKILLRILS